MGRGIDEMEEKSSWKNHRRDETWWYQLCGLYMAKWWTGERERERKVVDISRRYFVEESRTTGTAKPRREINGNNIYVGWDTWTKDDFGF